MATNFTITINACQADEFKYATITVNAGAGSYDTTTIWPVNTCGGCPYSKEELDKTCPNPEDREKIYAYDGVNRYEAHNEEEKIAHQQSIINSNGSYAWLFDCEKCIICDDLGSDSYSEFHYCKCAEDDPSVKNISCPGAQIGPIRLRSRAFNPSCLKFYDVWANVSLAADNWGEVNGAEPEGGIYCPNEGTTQCDSKCFQNGDIKCIINPYNAIFGAEDDASDGPKVVANVFATATNSSNGGPYALDVSAKFYFKLKNT